MTLAALLVVRSEAGMASAPVILSIASDVKQFGYYQRKGAKEAIISAAKNIAKATLPSQQQSVQHDEYKVYCCNRTGMCVLAFVDDDYPENSAFVLLNKVLDEYLKTFGDSWRTQQADENQAWNFLTEALAKYQDPAEADMLMKGQWGLQGTSTTTADQKEKQYQFVAPNDSETFTNSTNISEATKRRKLAENEAAAAITEEEVHDEDSVVAGSEAMEKQIQLILERIERFTEQVSEVLEAGKSLYKELSNDFEERVVAIHQHQVETWQDDIKQLQLVDEANTEAFRRIRQAMHLLPTFNQTG